MGIKQDVDKMMEEKAKRDKEKKETDEKLKKYLDDKQEEEDDEMEQKDLENLENRVARVFDAKIKDFKSDLEKRFDTIHVQINEVKKETEQACKDGKCVTDRLDSIDKVVNAIGETVTDKTTDNQISKVKTDIDSSIKGIDEKIAQLNTSVEKACTGVDCLTKRFDEEDNRYTCDSCKGQFFISENTVGDHVICPNCGAKYKIR